MLIVVDTLEKIRKPANGKTTLYSADYEAASGLQKIAGERGIAIVVIHDDRKADSEDVFDTVSGTLGLTAVAALRARPGHRGERDRAPVLEGDRLT